MIPFGSVEADASRGTASLIVNDLAVPDYFDIVNALTDHPAVPPIPGVVSYRADWGVVGEHVTSRPPRATSRPTSSGTPRRSNGLARYVSDPSSTSVSAFAEVGFERNGVFFDGNGHLFGGDDGAAVPGVDGGPSGDAPAAAAPSPLTDLNELSESIRERVDGRLAAHPVLDKLPGLD